MTAVAGCATAWDELTSRDVPWKERIHNAFTKPDPMQVLTTSTDGGKRGQALGMLKEPLQHGGTKEDQEFTVDLLRAAATKDPEPLCRLGAIKALANFKDARAVTILEEVYLQELQFTPELNSVIRQNALTALENTGHKEARHLLVRVARQPSGSSESSYRDRQQTNDERLTAIRALAQYREYDAVDALVYVLETEKDVALRDRAHRSLKSATGKNLPPEAAAWRELVQNPQATAARESGVWNRLVGLFGN